MSLWILKHKKEEEEEEEEEGEKKKKKKTKTLTPKGIYIGSHVGLSNLSTSWACVT